MGMTLIGVLIMSGVVAAFLAYQRSQSSVPVYEISPDDAEMIAARKKAQETLAELKEAINSGIPTAAVKIPVASSSRTIEYMVGDVIELTDIFVKVQVRGRPVTHSGAFQPVQSFPLREIADWFYELPNGKIRGGFTQRVHFARLRAAGKLGGVMKSEATKYE
jgi:uncharacterized protein YegJ (DUF2314 family)